MDDDPSDDEPPSGASKSVGRDYAPLFFILAIFFALVLLGFIGTFHKRFAALVRRPARRTTNSVYSQLTSADEFDLN